MDPVTGQKVPMDPASSQVKHYSINNDYHSINNDEHSINNDYHSINNDDHSINNDYHSINNDWTPPHRSLIRASSTT